MNLVIVESPAKAKTIEKYLGQNYKVLASFGHVRDLPKSTLGIDVEKNFLPKYVIPTKAKKVISELQKAEHKANEIFLATDLDREGEAIAWHLVQALKLNEKDPKVKRITFHEITKSAIENAIKRPRKIDMNLVDAQQARRVLDRLVGYKLSPLLWKKVKSGLSAGRVQSVAVRLVVEREDEIRKFVPEEYWVLGAVLEKAQNQFKAFIVEFDHKNIKKFDINNQESARLIGDVLKDAAYSVQKVERGQLLRKPSAPFTTSTMQMEASRKLGFSAKQTMMLAQKLYESGHITYMRTDSTNLSAEAIKSARELIVSNFGQNYLPAAAQVYQTKTKRAQEAHEAIRPTHFSNQKVSEDHREQKLYDLIWKRTIASQMKEAIFETITALIQATGSKEALLQAKGELMKFDGFMKVYMEGKDEEESKPEVIPNLVEGEKLEFKELISEQKFTEPPKRYTEATLVKKMESLGIGRPSTYAPTLSTIQDRGYVELIEKRFQPTEIGEIVTKLLVGNFSNIVDYQFTAKMEDNLDEIAEGEIKWEPVIKNFYDDFEKNLKIKEKELDKTEIVKPEILEEKCPDCGEPLLLRLGRYGKFIACSGFPKCKYSRPAEENKEEKAEIEAGEKCEKCGGRMMLKEGRFGKFLACENYPKCKSTKAIITKTGVKCPECGEGELVEKRTKRGKRFWGCSRYPGCKHATWNEPGKGEKE